MMNDFTKEELRIIEENMEDSYIAGYNKSLYNKIQSMIDNYCDHKEKVIDCDGGISLNCKACDKILVDE